MHPREQCAALMSVVEAMEEGICVYDARGHVAYRNGALRTLLDAERDRHRLQVAIDDVHRALVPWMPRPEDDAGTDKEVRQPPPHRVHVVVRTSATEYRVRGCAIAQTAAGDPAIVVSLHERGAARHWTAAQLKQRYALTPTEVRVASLLEGGLRSREIAAGLAISVHTARRHVEAVLRKLGVNSRSMVRSKLSRE